MHVPQTEVILRHSGYELARVILPPGEYVIGRGAEAQIHAETPLLSRKHALLTINYDSLLLEDLGSANGTFVNEQAVTSATRIFAGQSARLGDVQIEFHRLAAPANDGASLPPAQATVRRALPPELLADKRYAVGNVVAQGGMGAILDARQAAIDRTVAMKVMLETNDEGDILRFIDEAKITGQLDHPNIVPIYELGVDEHSLPFYTMKFVRGITLQKVLELIAGSVEATVKKYPLPALLTVFQKACDAIAFAHSKGVIHRDLKPANIMIGDFGSVLVMDWGLAKVLTGRDGSKQRPVTHQGSPPPPAHRIVASARGVEGSTMAGTVMGTPQYMAPEQARGEVETTDRRADVYALGGILFHIVHLRPAVGGTDPWEIVEKVKRSELDWTPLSKAAPDSLLAVCRKALAHDPAQRYANVEQLQADITAYQDGFATSAENAGWIKRVSLAVKRNKTASLAATLVLLLGTTLGTKAIVEGRRAERALADLKNNAPAMLALAESEGVAQRFDSELAKVEAALRLDPDLLPAYWRRAWCLVALGRFSDALAALRTAAQRDPAHANELTRIAPQLEKIAALPDEAARYAPENIAPVFDFLNGHDIRGEAGALIGHLRLNNDKRFALAKERLVSLCGNWTGLSQNSGGLIELHFGGTKLKSLEQVRGIPIDILWTAGSNLESVEALRGMRLVELSLDGNGALRDLSPLRGMPLRKLNLFVCRRVVDLSPLQGMPLESLNLDGSGVIDLSPLAGLPLHYLNSGNATNFQTLTGVPLESLTIPGAGFAIDLASLVGLPLKTLNGTSAARDLSPLLRITTLKRLATNARPDQLAALRAHPKLALINYKQQGYRPAAEVWAEIDAQTTKKK